LAAIAAFFGMTIRQVSVWQTVISHIHEEVSRTTHL